MSMYLEHFGLTEAPFKITAHTQFFFTGANRGETLQALIYAITSGEGMVKVTGEVGAGKTMLCRVLMDRLPDTVETIYLAVPSLTRDEMLAVVAEDLGIDVRAASTTKVIRALQEKLVAIHADGKQVVALIDEAHAMPLETLEEIRLLSNLETSHHKLMQIVLFGQPELDQHLSLPKMRQLKERITHSFHLQPLPEHQINDYLNFRLRAAGYKGPNLFGDDAIELIADASEGLTRRINIYADKTLLAAYAEDTHTITADHVRAAIADTQIVLTPSRHYVNLDWPALIAAGAIGIILGSGIGYLGGRMNAPKTPAPVAVEGKVQVGVSSASSGTPASPVGTPSGSTTGVTAPGAVAVATTATPSPATTASAPKPAGAAAPGATTTSGLAPSPTTTAVNAPKPAGVAAPASASAASNSATPAKAATTSKSTLPNAATPTAATNVRGGPLEARLKAGSKHIQELAADRYVVQLMAADPRRTAAIDEYLRMAARELDDTRLVLYPTNGRDGARIVVALVSFTDPNEATAEIAAMSDRVKRFRPFLRTVQGLRDGTGG